MANNKYLGSTNLVTFHDLIDNYLNDKIDLALPAIKLVGNTDSGKEIDNLEVSNNEAFSLLDNMAVFKDNKLVGYLTEEESKVYNLVMGNLKTTLVKTDFEDDEYVINEMVGIKCGVEVNPKKNKVSITVKGKAAISEANYSGDLTKNKTIKKLEKNLNDYTKEVVKKSVKKVLDEYNADIYGFEDMFYKKDPKYYKKYLKKNFDEVLKKLDIKVKSDIQIFEKGNLHGGVYEQK